MKKKHVFIYFIVITIELYFLIAHFLKGSPCKESFEVLKKELNEHQLLGIHYTCPWSGTSRPATFHDIVCLHQSLY